MSDDQGLKPSGPVTMKWTRGPTVRGSISQDGRDIYFDDVAVDATYVAEKDGDGYTMTLRWRMKEQGDD